MKALFLSLLLASAATVQAATPAMPEVRPIPESGQLPFGSAHRAGVNAIDLAAAGYVEEEYYLSGKAAVRDAKGTVVLAGQPYISRILIRKPKTAAKFSGTVIVTPFNWDKESAREWGYTKQYLLRHGDVFVGLSAVRFEEPGFYGPNGVKMLQAYDPVRYGPLTTYDDKDPKREEMPQSQDMFAQLALLLKSNAPASPLAGLKVSRLFAFSEGILGAVWTAYVSQGRHRDQRMPDGRPLYDGYLLGAYHLLPAPLPETRRDALYAIVQHQRELHRDIVAKETRPDDSDNPGFRFYEFVGSPHIGEAPTGVPGQLAAGNSAAEIAAMPKSPTPTKPQSPVCKIVNDEPVGLVFSAMLNSMDRWRRGEAAMPRAARVLAGPEGEQVDPATGNALGGLRPPWVMVPAASYPPAETVGCGSHEPKIPYSTEKLTRLYGSYKAYAARFTAAKLAFVKAGWLLPEDAVQMQPTAKPEDFK
jgi:Alpha/beta hydrolase domain